VGIFDFDLILAFYLESYLNILAWPIVSRPIR